jgi:hypothetical protein
MAKRFQIPAIPKGEQARYAANPFEPSIFGGGYYGFVAPVDGPRGPGVIVRPQDALLLQKGGVQAWIVYNKLLFDETVQTALVKMTQEITGREWKIEPVSDKPGDVAIKEFVEDTLRDLPVDEIYRGMLEAYITGFTVSEIMWKRTKRGVVPFDIRFRDQRRFRFEELLEGDYGFTMRMATREEPMVGVPLPARKFMVFRYWAHNNGDPYGAGLARVLYPLVKFKRRALESQLLYSDRFANPTAVAKAPLSVKKRLWFFLKVLSWSSSTPVERQKPLRIYVSPWRLRSLLSLQGKTKPGTKMPVHVQALRSRRPSGVLVQRIFPSWSLRSSMIR